MASDHVEQPFTKAVGLCRPDAVGLKELFAVLGVRDGDLAEGSVAGDDIGGHALVAGDFETMSAQGLEETLSLLIELEAVVRGCPAPPR